MTTTESLLSEDYLITLERIGNDADGIPNEMENIHNLFMIVDVEPSLRQYALEKYGLPEGISLEDVNQTAAQAWDRVKINLQRFQSDLFGYAKVIQSGADRLVERLTMMKGLSEKAGKQPFKDQIEVRKNQKFAINGKFEPFDIRPLLENTNNTFDFYDKVLLPFMKQIDQLLNTVELNQTWTDQAKVEFDQFEASKWMKQFKPLEQPDDRFRAGAYVVRGNTTQGERAIYYSGPHDTPTENVKDWKYFINVIRSVRYRYLKLQGQQPLNEADNKIDIENATTIGQRLNYLIGVAKRIQSRQGYDQKISAQLRTLERSADKLRSAAGQQRTQVDATNAEESTDQGRPAVSDVVKDLSSLMTSMTRITQDYNNAIAGQLRLVGALGFAADLELKAYEAPIEKPQGEVKAVLER